MYYLGSRYYSPEICRFISPDNESVFFKNFENFGQYNLYTYCWNNPVNMVDIMGYWPEWIEKAATLGAAAIAIVGAVAVTVVAFGAASVAGVVAITAALTVAARTTEVAILQARKSSSENKNGGEIAIDVVEAIYDNGQDIVGKLPYTKSAGVGFNYTKNQVNAVIKNKARSSVLSTLKATGGKALPYFFVMQAWWTTIYSAYYDSPLYRAEQRGYTLN